jgi:hypothetical protein
VLVFNGAVIHKAMRVAKIAPLTTEAMVALRARTFA